MPASRARSGGHVMGSGRSRPISAGGYTLIEMVATIAIIAILLALLLPSMRLSDEMLARGTCTNSLKDIYNAVYLYAQDNDFYGPQQTPYDEVPHAFYSLALQGYVGNVEDTLRPDYYLDVGYGGVSPDVWSFHPKAMGPVAGQLPLWQRCPSQQMDGGRCVYFGFKLGTVANTAYSTNDRYMGSGLFAANRLTEAHYPASLALAFDAGLASVNNAWNVGSVHKRAADAHGLLSVISGSLCGAQGRHVTGGQQAGDGINIAFADGGVRFLHATASGPFWALNIKFDDPVVWTNDQDPSTQEFGPQFVPPPETIE